MSKLHVYRFRPQGLGPAYEPAADIREIYANAMVSTANTIAEERGDDKDALYLAQCVRVFEIRVLEDPDDIDKIVEGFYEAIAKVDKELFWEFMLRVGVTLTYVFSLFMRRDAIVDRETLRSMVTNAQLHSMLPRMPKDLAEKVKEAFAEDGKYIGPAVTSDKSYMECVEDGSLNVTRCRDLAAKIVNCPVPVSWDEMAEMCDEHLKVNASKLSDVEQAALALAYPTYEYGLSVEIEEEEK